MDLIFELIAQVQALTCQLQEDLWSCGCDRDSSKECKRWSPVARVLNSMLTEHVGTAGVLGETPTSVPFLARPGSEMAETKEVNSVFLQQLMELGISEEKAKEMFSGFEVGESLSDAYKMVFVVNMELNMGIGKVGAQVAHAAVGLYRMMMEESDNWQQMLRTWDNDGAKKIVLKGLNTGHILELQEQACQLKLPNYLVQDAGRTQIVAGSRTVLAIMGEEKLVNRVTGSLQLL
ncbi:UBA_like_SF and PTH2 domain-containing protein isoform X2 [Heptranchias perlo]|uniref:UBA_like_SF and PTH2 domain-containing protein isoform X2 n=1 Tax=Heptranchias perlo TaxID=212740 RepID=UPI00355A6866